MTDMAPVRAQSMGEIEGRRRKLSEDSDEYNGSRGAVSGDDRPTTIDTMFDLIDEQFHRLREDIGMLEDKLGPYLRSEPVPGDDSGNKPSGMGGRSSFYEQLERYPAIIDNLRGKVNLLTHLVDR